MPVHRHVNPAKVAKPPGYTHVVEATTPGRIIYLAGQLGLDIENTIVGGPGDFRAQAEQTFLNLKHALEAADAGFEHVVKLNNYLVDMAHLGIFREVRDKFVDTSAPPASTTIAISNLARPGALLEVELVAVVPHKAAPKPARAKAARKGAARKAAKPAGRARSAAKPKAAKPKAASRKRK
jgi:enamine deaminase RidA (YjgF/YER057c/UK114 family)